MSTQWIWLDWIFLAILALSTLIAFFRGFVREALSLISWVVALILALYFGSKVGETLFSSFKSASVQYGSGFLLIFFGVLVLGMIINFFIGKLIQVTGLDFFDALLGGFFGLIRGACLVLIVIILLAMPSFNMSDLLNRSAIASWINPLVVWLMKDLANHPEYIPVSLQDAIR